MTITSERQTTVVGKLSKCDSLGLPTHLFLIAPTRSRISRQLYRRQQIKSKFTFGRPAFSAVAVM